MSPEGIAGMAVATGAVLGWLTRYLQAPKVESRVAPNGTGEWRGRIESLLEQQQQLQRDQMHENSELRRVAERNTLMLERTGEALDGVARLLQGADKAIGRSEQMAREVHELWGRE